MNNYGFVRFAGASPAMRVADCDYNTTEILNILHKAEKDDVVAIVFPELSITGYTCADLFLNRSLLDEAKVALMRIIDETKKLSVLAVVGMPLEVSNKLYNVAVVLKDGCIHGIVPKTFLPNYNEFYEKRWFSSASELKESEVGICGQVVPVGTDLIFEANDFKFSIEICEDLWSVIPPSSLYSLNGADVIFNLSASNEIAGKHHYRKSLVSHQSARCLSGYVYASAGNGESSTDLVFSGETLIAENGVILSEGERFSFDNTVITADIDIERLRNERLKNKSFSLQEYDRINEIAYRNIIMKSESVRGKDCDFLLKRYISPTPFVPQGNESLNTHCEEIFSLQSGGLAKRMLHTRIKNAVIGVSGGLDSTLALLVLVKTFDKLGLDRKGIYGITMPGFGTTDRTYTNAIELMQALGVTVKEISIREATLQHFADIDHDKNVHDVTYENSQARERTQILMDYANKVNALVIGTGDLSELALGWCTYNGDHMSMYAVNVGVPKTLVKTLVSWIGNTQMEGVVQGILEDVVATPVSPELLPAEGGNMSQITEDLVGPYLLHDFFIYYMLRFGFSPKKILYLAQHAFKGEYSKEEILKWLKVFMSRFFSQQFKRSCLPDGPKVGSINLSPRGDWRMPSDAVASVWLKQLTDL